MTSYSPTDLAEGWEFKILRSNGAFGKPERLHAFLQEEEKLGGWVLVEKFSNSRIRLKRRAGLRVAEEDIAGGYDPYRTYVGGSSEMTIAFLVIGGILGFVMAIFLYTLALR